VFLWPFLHTHTHKSNEQKESKAAVAAVFMLHQQAEETFAKIWAKII
jgi:hypothetical protein